MAIKIRLFYNSNMKIGEDYNKNIAFKGMWNNKAVLKGLETVSEHGTSFIAGTTFVMASGVRPLSILATPNVKEENKQYAISNSIASGSVKFILGLAIALPIEKAIKNTEKYPEKFLKKETIDSFTKNSETITNSRKFKFATQFMKQSIGFLTAIPKSIATVALIPVLNNKIFFQKQNNNIDLNKNEKNTKYSSTPSFKGGITDIGSKGIGKILDSKIIQKTSEKLNLNDTDISRNMAVATDILLTSSFAYQTQNNKEIEEKRKKPLIMNTVYGTIASIAAGCTIDELVKKNTKNFIEKFKEINKNDAKLPKYIEGINIVRPTFIFAGIYYGLLPMITTYLADKTEKE